MKKYELTRYELVKVRVDHKPPFRPRTSQPKSIFLLGHFGPGLLGPFIKILYLRDMMENIEDIHFFLLLNLTFISSSEVQNIYIS